jgi:hypothetical protein
MQTGLGLRRTTIRPNANAGWFLLTNAHQKLLLPALGSVQPHLADAATPQQRAVGAWRVVSAITVNLFGFVKTPWNK